MAPANVFVQLLIQIACGLKQLHSLGMAHNDLKPENMLVFTDEGIKLTDFGLATFSQPAFRRQGHLLFTEPYRAPELSCPGGVPKDIDLRASDMWALGLIFLELIMYKFHPDLNPSRIYRRNSYSNKWQDRLIHLMLKKGNNPDFFQNCFQGFNIKPSDVASLKKSWEHIPSEEDGLNILNAFYAPYTRSDKKTITQLLSANTTPLERKLLAIVSHLIQINPEKRWTAQQVITSLLSIPSPLLEGVTLEPCQASNDVKFSTPKLSPVATQVKTDLFRLLTKLIALPKASINLKSVERQIDDLKETYDRIVYDLNLSDPKPLRGAFALAVLLHWGGPFVQQFLARYSWWEFVSLLDLQTETLELMSQLEKQPYFLLNDVSK
jgi:serine/threonine protein kinase